MPHADESNRPFLDFQRFRFSLRIISHTVLPAYKGGVFRGAFGNALKKSVCVDRARKCSDCALDNRCLYKAYFEPACPQQIKDARKFSRPPTPYIIVPPLTDRRFFEPGDTLWFELVLMGDAIDALPYFIFAFMEMGRYGLGSERGKYELVSVDVQENGDSETVYDGARESLAKFTRKTPTTIVPGDHAKEAISLALLTPMRIKVKSDLVTQLTFPVLFERLAKRLRLLVSLYGDATRLSDFTSLYAHTQDIRVTEYDLHWFDWERYSGRQKTTMKFGGLKGRIAFSGPLGPFMPYLRLGEHLSIGQETTFGLGRVHIIG